MSLMNRARTLSLSALLVAVIQPLHALEVGVDGSFSTGALVDDWGASGHVQLIQQNGWGLDLGYDYYNSVTYDALATTLTHPLQQFDVGLLYQVGDQAFRLQGHAGGVWSNTWVQSSGVDVIERFSPGYQLGLDFSVPLFTNFRVFADAKYQGWLNSEMPNHVRWRYGVRLNFGGTTKKQLEAQELAEQKAEEERQQQLLENPPITINTNVPEYMPGHLSQSLPPIVAKAELCRCYPAGPYTLQLGEFGNYNAAVRGLEYRGLRQFFNSRAYQRRPLPVFLTQSQADGPVSLYMGEIKTIEEMQYWRHELRKSGLSAQFRKIVGGNGQRIANPIVAMEDFEVAMAPVYTAEEIRRMNSLPEDYEEDTEPAKDSAVLQAELEAWQAELAERRALENSVDDDTVAVVQAVLQLGPLPMNQTLSLLSADAMQAVLARNSYVRTPANMTLIWDEGRQESWFGFQGFASEQHVDEWNAWFQSEGYSAQRVDKLYEPIGDVYQFALGQRLQEFSLEIERQQSMTAMLQSMRSPEVLWFQAYQRINSEPLETSLNWSANDNRYHLIVNQIRDEAEQQQVWTNLSIVGLLPALAEE